MDKRESQLEKVRSLLAKAESTPFAEEAKAFFEGAQRIMTIYAIEEAEIRQETRKDEKPIMVTVLIERPYAMAKAVLLNSVSNASNCIVTIPHSSRRKGKDSFNAYLHGFSNRVTDVEMLYTSLLVQCQAEMFRIPKPDGVHGKTWFNNFMLGYAEEIANRLAKAKRDAEKESSVGNALVLLRNEKAAVKDFVGKTGTSKVASSYHAGARGAGRDAGSRASFGKGSVMGGRRGLSA